MEEEVIRLGISTGAAHTLAANVGDSPLNIDAICLTFRFRHVVTKFSTQDSDNGVFSGTCVSFTLQCDLDHSPMFASKLGLCSLLRRTWRCQKL
jgi:hypothetical protein